MAGTHVSPVESAVASVGADRQMRRALAEREASIIRAVIALYNGHKLSPERALAAWAQMAEISSIEAALERDARKAIGESEAKYG